jgi:hypothetical protein
MAQVSASLLMATPITESACGIEGCDPTRIGPTDLYCEHDRFLPTAKWSTAGRITFALLWRSAVAYAFLLSALKLSQIPIFLVCVALGIALVGLPLRRTPATMTTVSVVWVAMCAIVPLIAASGDARSQTVMTFVGTTVFTVWGLSFSYFSVKVDESNRHLGGVFIAIVAWALVCFGLTMLRDVPLVARFFDLPEGARDPLRTLGSMAAVAAGLVAVFGGLIRALDNENPRVRDLLQQPQQPSPMVRLKRRPQRTNAVSRDFGSLILRGLTTFVDHVGLAATMMMRFTVHTLRWLRYWTVLTLVKIINGIWRWLRESTIIIVQGLQLVPGAFRLSGRVIVIPFVGLTVGAWLADLFAAAALAYLTAGSLSSLGSLALDGIGAVLALTAAWISVSQYEVRPTARSATVNLSASAANVLVLTAAAGWILGLLGTFGHGPIHIGPVTIGATLILLVSAGWSAVKNRSQTQD